MFSIPGKQAVRMTDAAASQISRLMQKDGHQGLRIGVKKGGCAGMEYTMDCHRGMRLRRIDQVRREPHG